MSENLIGATTAVFPIRLSVAVASPVDVEWATRDGSAVAGLDYKAAAGILTFLPGETEKQIEVQVYGQAITPADDKVFFIRLNPPSNAVLVDAILTCTINIIDDQGITSVAVVVAEGRRGPKGDPGLSAYEQAVLMGYTGTLAEWMDQIADASKAADRAGDHAVSAAEDALKAQNAAKNAVFAGVVFPTAAEGVDPILGVQNGAYFNVRSPLSEHYIDEYQNVNGVAVATGKSYPTSDYVQDISEHTALPFVLETVYKLNQRVALDNGDIVKSTVDGNANDPNVDMTGWVKVSNNIVQFNSYAELRNYKGGGFVVKVSAKDIDGHFLLDSSDTTSLDNDGTIVVDVKNRRWKRSFDGHHQASWFGIVGDGVTVNTTKVNAAIKYISEITIPHNGGVLEFDSGIYIANIEMKSRVRLLGKGVNTTIIKSAANVAIPTLNAENTVAFFGWQDISFDGNKQNGATGIGIHIQHSQAGSVVASKISDKTVTGGAPYRYSSSSNFTVSNCGNDGIKIGDGRYGNYAIMWSDFHSVYNDGHGFYNSSSDNIFYSFYAERNGKAGFYNIGGNNKFIGVKAIWNGLIDDTYAGVYNNATRCDFVAAEAQDNNCTGFILGGNDCLYDILSDSNGYLQGQAETSSRKHCLVQFLGGTNISVRARLTNYKARRLNDGFYPAEWAYKIANNTVFSKFDVTTDGRISNQAPQGYKKPSSISNFVVCNRIATVVENGVSYTKDHPVINNSGFILHADEKLEITGAVNLERRLSYHFEFELSSIGSGATSVRLVKSADDAFVIYLVLTGGTAPQIQVSVKTNSGVHNNFLKGSGIDQILASDLAAGTKFSISGNWAINEIGAIIRTDTVCIVSTDGSVKSISNTRGDGIGARFNNIKNVVFSEESIQAWIGKVLGFALWCSGTSKHANLNQFATVEGVTPYATTGGIYADFTLYNTKLGVNETRISIPEASSFYRGQALIKFGGVDIADTSSMCTKNADNTYTWKSLY